MKENQASQPRVAVVVEDDPDIAYLLEQVLLQAGFETVLANNGEDGVRAVAENRPLVTTLDISLPGIDGFEVARRIRAMSDSYIVMISALDEEIDMLQGLEAGADDFLTKPFRPRELRARITAMLRRPRQSEPEVLSQPAAVSLGNDVFVGGPAHPLEASAGPHVAAADAVRPPAAPIVPAGTSVAGSVSAPTSAAREWTDDPWVEHNGLRVDLEARVVEVDGEVVELTRTEFELIAALLESRRRVRTKADLALVLHGDPYVTTHFVGEADRRNVEVHMANLRRKLGDSAATPRFVMTVRGVGYRLTGPGDAGYFRD